MFLPELNLTLQRQVTGKMRNTVQGMRQFRHEINNLQDIYKGIMFIISDNQAFLCIGAYIGNKQFIAPTSCGNCGRMAVFGRNNGVRTLLPKYQATYYVDSLTVYTLEVSCFT